MHRLPLSSWSLYIKMIDDKNSLWDGLNIQRRELYVKKEKPQEKKQENMKKRFRQILQITITG